MVGLYLEQLLNAAQGMMKVSRGGTVLHRLYSAIEDDAAAKGQDGRNNLITARNDYYQELLRVGEQMKEVGRGSFLWPFVTGTHLAGLSGLLCT
jgi:hypothetical protein